MLGLRSLRHATRLLSLQQQVVRQQSYSSLPRVAQPSFWQSLVPKAFRSSQPSTSEPAPRKPVVAAKPWNPATFFIVIFLIIGSNAVNIIAVRKDHIAFSRQADAKIAALKDAIERVQRGEDVDVRRLLGTGDPQAEQEWEDVLKELQQERLDDPRQQRRAAKKEERRKAAAEDAAKIGKIEEEEWVKLAREGKIGKKAEFY